MLLKLVVRVIGGFWTFRTVYSSSRIPLLRRVFRFVYSNYLESLGSYIAIDAAFAGEPKFPHKPMGIFIAPGARFGTNVVIYQQVTVGVNELIGSRGAGSPTIGNDVFIGAGARIIGGVKIGDGARIGAGAIVVTDVAPGALAVSPKAVMKSSRL